MKIGNFDLEKDGVFIIAELSANHGGKIEIAKETIKAAKVIGANCIKLQTYT
ncbi:MAG: pseudaminic acid synthase, partial [Candidatus Gracilibacteria bacterium]|nr:pseudaminic acid synthase [Candidatus Gracilibacteria bacterium]